MLPGQDLRRRHERHLQTVLHRHNRGEQGHDRLAGADVALQQPVHRLRLPHVVDDLLDGLSLTRREPERQDLRRRSADTIVHGGDERLQLHTTGVTPPRVSDLKQKELLKDHPALLGRTKSVELVDGRVVRRKM